MGRSKETFGKKENEKNKQKKRQEKEEKKRLRKEKGSASFEDMIAYVDEFGQISSTPPDPNKKPAVVNAEDISLDNSYERPEPESQFHTGVVASYNTSKGYGFIKDQKSQKSYFVHASSLLQPIKENDKVKFETETNKKGINAINVTIMK